LLKGQAVGMRERNNAEGRMEGRMDRRKNERKYGR
jgi:hypothetical protein